MADNQEDRSRDDLSDEPSPYKIEEMRRKGRVSQSRELSGLVALMAGGVALYTFSPNMGTYLGRFMSEMFNAEIISKLDLTNSFVLANVLFKLVKTVVYIIAPVLMAIFVLGILGSYVQIGPIFSTDPLTPKLEKINPIAGLKKLISMKKLYDGIRLVIRGSVVSFVAYLLVKGFIFQAPNYTLSSPETLIGTYGNIARVIFLALCAVLLVFALFDLWIERWDFGKNIRLTKQEAKQEFKEHEGDPLIKARIRAIQKEMARKRMMNAVKEADVVITNPTHIAIALSYKRDNMNAPKVIAKGADFIAQKIKKIAVDAGVPLVENKPLARTLYRTVKIGQYVPRALYQAVAEVLAYVYKLKSGRVD